MSDLLTRLKDVASLVHQKGEVITLNSGRRLVMYSMKQKITYGGLLEGIPHASINDGIINRFISEHTFNNQKPHILHAPRNYFPVNSHDENRLKRMGWHRPELLPHKLCIARFESDQPARDTIDSEMSYLNVIWFQDEWAMPIAPEVIELLKACEWEMLAYDGGY